MKKYTVFIRRFYKYGTMDAFGRKKLLPDPHSRRTKIASDVDEETALALCRKWNSENKPGPLSRKAEYTSDY